MRFPCRCPSPSRALRPHPAFQCRQCVQGMSNKEIARALKLAVGTVKCKWPGCSASLVCIVARRLQSWGVTADWQPQLGIAAQLDEHADWN